MAKKKRYKYKHFSFIRDEHLEGFGGMIEHHIKNTPIYLHVNDTVRPTNSFIGYFIIVRIFQWSNGYVTVVGYVV